MLACKIKLTGCTFSGEPMLLPSKFAFFSKFPQYRGCLVHPIDKWFLGPSCSLKPIFEEGGIDFELASGTQTSTEPSRNWKKSCPLKLRVFHDFCNVYKIPAAMVRSWKLQPLWMKFLYFCSPLPFRKHPPCFNALETAFCLEAGYVQIYPRLADPKVVPWGGPNARLTWEQPKT